MKAALQICSRDFDADFFKLPLAIQRRIEGQIDRLGLMLDRFSHTHLTGMDCYVLDTNGQLQWNFGQVHAA